MSVDGPLPDPPDAVMPPPEDAAPSEPDLSTDADAREESSAEPDGDALSDESSVADGDASVPGDPVSSFRYDEALYVPISADAPTGAAIEFYHFSEMEQELAWPLNDFGRPDASQRPNFRAVRDMALGLLKGTKDLKPIRDVRPLLALAIAEAGDKGPVGLAKALDLFVELATTHWDAIHPQKEDEDDDELMTRMEEMRKYMNPQIVSLAVESVGIARSPRVGDLTTRTFGIAATKVSPRDGEFAPNAGALTALMAEEDEVRAGITEAHNAYMHAIDRLRAMEAFLNEHPDVDPLDCAGVADALEKQAAFLAPFVGDAAGDAGTLSADADDSADSVLASQQAAAAISGPSTLAEAMSLMDDILVFYANSGRSSPVPLGLIALRDLMAGDFNTWVTQTAPTGLSEAAINIAAIDASRLSSFASGDAPAAVAPVSVSLDFTEFDSTIYDAETAFSTISNALYQHQLGLPAEDGEEMSAVLNDELQQMRDALDKLQAARIALESQTPDAGDDAIHVDNPLQGDSRHSRITDRNGVKQALDGVAAYFEREEPSSPAPAYLRRLRSLVDARFTEIARELMPEEGGEVKLRLEPRTNLR